MNSDSHDNFMRQLMAEQQIPGLAVGVQRGDQIVYEGYFGHANLEHHVPVRAETAFEIASVTKLFTSQAILRLAQEGRLRLSDPLHTYLAQLPDAWRPVTIRDCLAHQSGIRNYTSVARYWEITREAKSHDAVLDLVRELPLDFAPRTRHAYDNTGYYLLGMVIEAITGQSYGDALHDLIFEPLGLKETQANDYERIVPHRAQGYVLHNGVLLNKPFYDTSNTFSAGILLSTVRDLLRWHASAFDDSILDAAHRQLWLTAQPSQAQNERDNHYTTTLGWFRVDTLGTTFLGHNGGITGFASAFLYFPHADVTTVLLCNTNHVSEPHSLALALLQHLQLV